MTEERLTFYQSYLFTEDKTLKIYVDDEHEVTFVPFPSHYISHPGQHEHFKNIKGESALITEFKDYGRIDHPMDDGDDDVLAEIQDDD